MLHAELRGKLDETASNLCRIEDILTSTVFGTLLLSDSGLGILSRWLSCATRFGPDGRLGGSIPPVLPDPFVVYWFWQSLTEAEPDLLLRIGERLFVIEAKYRSSMGRGDDDDSQADPEAESPPSITGSQLAREWRSCQVDTAKFFMYPPDLRAAIAECDLTLVYLVSADHRIRAVEELRSSWSDISPASDQQAQLSLLTWQDLHRVLVLDTRRAQPPPARWIREMASLMEGRHLASFIGFPQSLEAWKAESLDAARAWTASWTVRRAQALSQTLDGLNLNAIGGVALARWRLAASRMAEHTAYRALDGLNLHAAGRVASASWWSGRPTSVRRDLAERDLDAVHAVASTVWRKAASAKSGEGT